MTIQDLGSIGELIAAIATIVTLLYLALQLRENTTAIRGEARRASRSSSGNANLAIAQDIKVAALFNAGLRDFDSLSPDEHTQFAFLLAEIVSAQQASHEEVVAGILPKEHLSTLADSLGPLIGSPGGHKWWKRYRRGYPSEFRKYVDDEILPRPPVQPAAQQSAAADSA